MIYVYGFFSLPILGMKRMSHGQEISGFAKIHSGYRPAHPIITGSCRVPVDCLQSTANRLRINRKPTRNRLSTGSEVTRNRVRIAGLVGRFGGYGAGFCSRM